MNWMNGLGVSLLEKGLDGTWARQVATLDNLGNYETPNYKKKVVSFESQLQAAMEDRRPTTRTERANAVRATSPMTGVDRTLTLRDDGNNVDVEAENISLARAQLQYSTYTQQLNSYFTRLRTAINGAAR